MTTLEARDPEHIAISKSKGIEIDWKDGHHSSYGTEYLQRRWCPCASCTGSHGTEPREKTSETTGAQGNPFQMYKEKIKMVAIEPVGSYAVRIEWNDGHNTGDILVRPSALHLPLPRLQGRKR